MIEMICTGMFVIHGLEGLSKPVYTFVAAFFLS